MDQLVNSDGTQRNTIVGKTISIERTFTPEDVVAFGKLSRDTNAIHYNEASALVGPVHAMSVPGFLSSMMFSELFGRVFPGDGTLYVKQEFRFRAPMFPGKAYRATAKFIRHLPIRHWATVVTTIRDVETEQITIDGEAIIKHQERI